MEPVRRWSGRQPPGDTRAERTAFARRIAQRLSIPARRGYRDVRDPDRHEVRVELDRVLYHIGLRRDHEQRWRHIPAIIPAIEEAAEIYQRDGEHRDPESREDRPAYVHTYLTPLEVAHHDGAEGVAWYEVRAYRWRGEGDQGRYTFDTVVPKQQRSEVATQSDLRRVRRRAGTRIGPRQGSNPAYMGPREAGREDRATQRVPDAVPALPQSTTPPASTPNRPLRKLAALALGIGVLYQLAQRQAAA